jgi:hypothetical protein
MLERRAKLRAHTALPGHAAFATLDAEVACTILDFSSVGACLTFEDGVAVPRLFALRIGLDPDVYEVRVVWRRPDRLGVAFLNPRAIPDVVAG